MRITLNVKEPLDRTAEELGGILRSIADAICQYAVKFFQWLASWFSETSALPLSVMSSHTETHQIKIKELAGIFSIKDKLCIGKNIIEKNPFATLAIISENSKYKDAVHKYLLEGDNLSDCIALVSDDMTNYTKQHPTESNYYKLLFIENGADPKIITTAFATKNWRKLVQCLIYRTQK